MCEIPKDAIAWLPGLISFEGDWDDYLEKIYGYYSQDFIDTKPMFRSTKLGVKKKPYYAGKTSNFWHLIQEDTNGEEEDRIPQLRRCERIRWPKPIIENCDMHKGIKTWESSYKSKKGRKKRIYILFSEVDFIVILDRRNRYILFWTAFPLRSNREKNYYLKQYELYK